MRRPLDMLPLLDVFMVVLFVFASIQEGQIDALQDRLEGSTKAREKALAEQSALLDEKLQALRDLRNQQSEATDDAAEESVERRLEVLDGLLEKSSVVEIEIDGRLTDDGSLEQRCCFRRDPRTETWLDCGEVPLESSELDGWLAKQKSLSAALRDTKGGSGLTLLRQDPLAAYQIGSRVGESVRRQFPDQRLYVMDPEVIDRLCGSPPAERDASPIDADDGRVQ